MKQEHIINVQGSEFVKYEGLLDEAHQQGLKRISTTVIQLPHPDNGNVCVVAAEVETTKGTFSGIGDCSPANTSRMIAPHSIRMAETRAKARALRDAVNVGMTSLEELGDDKASAYTPPKVDPARDMPDAMEDYERSHHEPDSNVREMPKASPYKPASANQLGTISKLAQMLKVPIPEGDLTSAQASEHITRLSALYNERKTQPRAAR